MIYLLYSPSDTTTTTTTVDPPPQEEREKWSSPSPSPGPQPNHSPSDTHTHTAVADSDDSNTDDEDEDDDDGTEATLTTTSPQRPQPSNRTHSPTHSPPQLTPDLKSSPVPDDSCPSIPTLMKHTPSPHTKHHVGKSEHEASESPNTSPKGTKPVLTSPLPSGTDDGGTPQTATPPVDTLSKQLVLSSQEIVPPSSEKGEDVVPTRLLRSAVRKARFSASRDVEEGERLVVSLSLKLVRSRQASFEDEVKGEICVAILKIMLVKVVGKMYVHVVAELFLYHKLHNNFLSPDNQEDDILHAEPKAGEL